MNLVIVAFCLSVFFKNSGYYLFACLKINKLIIDNKNEHDFLLTPPNENGGYFFVF